MLENADKRIKELLRRQTLQLTEQALASGGEISSEQIASIERLARLNEVLKATKSPLRKRWPAAIVYGLTLLLVSALLFWHVPETAIEADLVTSSLSFISPSQQVLLDVRHAVSLGVAGLSDLALPDVVDTDQHFRKGGSASAIRLSAVGASKPPKAISLERFAVPPGTRVSLRTTDLPNQVRLTLQGKDMQFRVSASGPVAISIPGRGSGEFSFPVAVPIALRAAAGDVDLDIESGSPQLTFEPQVLANNPSFFRTEQFAVGDRTIVRSLSTIISGTIYYQSLGDRSKPLRAGEQLRFGKAEGEIRSLGWKDGHLSIQFHGAVSGLSSGPEGNANNIMPTYLEWFQARHGAALLWAASLYLSGMVLGVLRWWKGE
jgi:hypothetical protein